MITKVLYIATDYIVSDTPLTNKELYCTEYRKGKKLHRLDGPAREYPNGSKYYYVEGNRHRLDGPAIERADGSKQYWVNGVEVTDKLKGIKEEDIPKYLRMLLL